MLTILLSIVYSIETLWSSIAYIRKLIGVYFLNACDESSPVALPAGKKQSTETVRCRLMESECSVTLFVFPFNECWLAWALLLLACLSTVNACSTSESWSVPRVDLARFVGTFIWTSDLQ